MGVGTMPPCPTTTPPPSPPSRGAGRYGRRIQGRRPGKKRRRTPAGQSPQKLEEVGPGRKKLFLPGVLSSGFLPKKAGPPPGVGGEPTSQGLPCASPEGPQTGAPCRVGALRALRPEASEKPRPPEGYAVPHRPPPGEPPLLTSAAPAPPEWWPPAGRWPRRNPCPGPGSPGVPGRAAQAGPPLGGHPPGLQAQGLGQVQGPGEVVVLGDDHQGLHPRRSPLARYRLS